MKLDDIKVGQEIYEVGVFWTSRKVPCVKNVTHYTIISLPDMQERNNDKTVYVLEEDSIKPIEKNLHEKNVFPNNHNLDRWFKTREEADTYAKRIYTKDLTYTEKLIVEESNVTSIANKESKNSIASRVKSAFSFG